jgi:hypothetical protein
MKPSSKLAGRIAELTNRPRFTIPGVPKEIATMNACALLVLVGDLFLRSEALAYAQQGVLAPAIRKAAGTTLAAKVQDVSIRPMLEAYSLLTSGLRKRDYDLTRKEPS